MLKKVSLTAFVLALLLVLPLLGSCSKKTALTETDFTDLTQQAGYAVTDMPDGTNRFDNTQDVTTS
ncbi:MAG: hypothetical protein FWD71_09790, partial [Oscillospiraceae bacterium]|nr:hypothetical protein [Oscillospiraceae bacterium]